MSAKNDSLLQIEEIVRIYANSKYLDKNVRRVLFILAEYISIITTRLTFYFEAYGKLSENKASLRKNYCTKDNAFILHSIITKYRQRKRKPIDLCRLY